MTLYKYYRNAVIYPSLLMILLTMGYSVIDNYHYESDWLTADFLIFIALGTSIGYSLIISGLSLTIFLNKYEKVRSNKVLNALSWFFLPFGCIAIVFVYDIYLRQKYEVGFRSDFMYLLLMNIPFIFGLIWTYIKFQRSTYSPENV